jgi:preprotein translocase subunit Sec63
MIFTQLPCLILGVIVRKAYRRKALQTHPDRLPPTATAEQKENSEELFRKVLQLFYCYFLV